jgi:hypothetical protein
MRKGSALSMRKGLCSNMAWRPRGQHIDVALVVALLLRADQLAGIPVVAHLMVVPLHQEGHSAAKRRLLASSML